MTILSLEPSSDWTLPEDWREVATRGDEALAVLTRFSNAVQGEELTLPFLSDVVGAAGFVLQVPKNLRGKSFERYSDILKQATTPRLKKLSAIVGLALNPLNTVGKLLDFAGQRLDHSDLDFIEIFARNVMEEAVTLQLDYCLVEVADVIGDQGFEQRLGRTAYWYAFRESEFWQMRTDLELTPDLANDAMKRHRAARDSEYRDPSFVFNLWINSPWCKDPLKELGKRSYYVKKLSKGRRFAKMDKAWVAHVREIENRHRFVYLFAERSSWERN